MFKTINTILKVISLLIILLILSVSYLIVTEFTYKSEIDTINTAYDTANLPPPTWNTTTRYFEVRDNTTFYIGYIKFYDMNHSVLDIIEFKNASVIQYGNTYSYASVDNEHSVIYTKKLVRRFR